MSLKKHARETAQADKKAAKQEKRNEATDLRRREGPEIPVRREDSDRR